MKRLGRGPGAALDGARHGLRSGVPRGVCVLAALREGRAQAGAVGDLLSGSPSRPPGRIDPTQIEVLWTTPGFDHCMFDALPTLRPEKAEGFRRALFAMRWDDPRHRRLLELEGLKEWMPPREEGYASLRAALDEQDGW